MSITDISLLLVQLGTHDELSCNMAGELEVPSSASAGFGRNLFGEAGCQSAALLQCGLWFTGARCPRGCVLWGASCALKGRILRNMFLA